MRKQAHPRAENGKPEAPDNERPAHQFQPGNKAAEKWTPEVVLEKLNKIYDKLREDEDKPGRYPENPVRANTIKFVKEVCLIVGVSSKTYTEWKEKFTYPKRRNYQTNEMEDNPTYNEDVSELIQTISDICECRLGYSGAGMDIFVLKNHYGFVDQVDHTTNGHALPGTTVSPVVKIFTTPDDDDE